MNLSSPEGNSLVEATGSPTTNLAYGVEVVKVAFKRVFFLRRTRKRCIAA
jgi:hypothetical protein